MAEPVQQHFDIASLERYLEQEVPNVKLPIEVKKFGFGQSNPTYQLTDKEGTKFVLRKKPPGQLLSKTAHQVEREYKVLHALQATDMLVPKVYCLCEDSDVVGTPFYVMEFLDGRIYEDPALPGVLPEDRNDMWKAAVQTLAKLHLVKPDELGLAGLGKHGNFYARQLKTFNAIHNAQATVQEKTTGEGVGKIPHFDALAGFFAKSHRRIADRSCLVHGDYKIDNLVFHKIEPRVIGILDWEMATIGHPLSDLCNFLVPYTMAAVAESGDVVNEPFLPGHCPGLPSKGQIMAWYREISGWDPEPESAWGDAFCMYRGSIILQGIAARQVMGVASSAKSHEYAGKMKPFADMVWKLIGGDRNMLAKPSL